MSFVLVGAASAASPRVLATGSATGTVTVASGASFTIQTTGRRTGVVNALTAAANSITSRDYPYVYGGGHAQAGIASIGIKGPGYNGHRTGFDCSGSVAAVLAGAGLWVPGSGVPNDAGIIATLLHERLIARGVGKGPVEVTLYDQPGVHIFMNIDGRFFGTSDGGGGGNPRGGAGWLDDSAPDASHSVYKIFHFLPSVLKGSANTGHILGFQFGAVRSVVSVGDELTVGYEETSTGSLIATSISYVGAVTTTGTVTSVADDDSAFTVETPAGQVLTFSTGADPELVQNLEVGDTLQVTYTSSGGIFTARSLTVTGAPAGDGPGAGGGSGGWNGAS